MGLSDLLRTKERGKPMRLLMGLADQYIAFMGSFYRSAREVRRLSRRLGKLMSKHEIDYIARRDCLLKVKVDWDGKRYSPFVEIGPLPMRLNDRVRREIPPATNLISLVDRLLEADGGFERDKECRKALCG